MCFWSACGSTRSGSWKKAFLELAGCSGICGLWREQEQEHLHSSGGDAEVAQLPCGELEVHGGPSAGLEQAGEQLLELVGCGVGAHVVSAGG